MRIKKERVREYLKKPINKQGNYVLYWMQRSQRATSNHALDLSIKYANEFDLPLLILFIVLNKYPESNERHYYFMLEGLREVEKNINNAGGNFVIKYENDKEIKKIFENASIIIFDKGYTKFEKQLRENKAKKATQKIYEVESDLIVPVEAASDKEEYAAYTIRKKLNNLRNNFLNYNKNPEKLNNTGKIEFNSLNICNIEEFFKNLNINKEVRKSQYFTGGRKEALNKLDTFIENKLEYYEEFSNDPTKNYISNLSPYLHFGQISPLFIMDKILKSSKKNTEAFIEQLFIRRELSFNFVYYNENYDSLKSLPEWAKNSLKKHEKDKREKTYSLDVLESAQTEDIYWNSAQKEMMITGKMHNYMRMYWGKKILEWSESPQVGFKNTIYLNNKYSLDGRDPNSYAGIAWCYGKHDRAWKERNIYGKVRYMNANGLKRKFNIDKYFQLIKEMEIENE